MLIQRVWRGIGNFNSTIKMIARRQDARLKIQRVLKRRARHNQVMREVQRRITIKAELAEKVRLQALEEAKEVNVLKKEREAQE